MTDVNIVFTLLFSLTASLTNIDFVPACFILMLSNVHFTKSACLHAHTIASYPPAHLSIPMIDSQLYIYI